MIRDKVFTPAVLFTLALTSGLLPTGTAEAQGTAEMIPPSALPRPGYEPRTLRLGSTTIRPELSIGETYDSNVFAEPDGGSDDLVTTISPTLRIETGPERLSLYSATTATHSEYLQHPGESRTTYGTSIGSRYLLSQASTLEASLNYDRLAESRGDPESDLQSGDPITLFDDYGGSFSYGYLRNRVGLRLDGNIRHVDYEMPADYDRDRTEARVAGRASFLLSPRWNTFVEGYSTRRDYEAAIDEAGIDRDETIYGFLAGTGVDLTGKLNADIGVGLFQTDNDDGALEDFIGLGVRGGLRWSITPRTMLSASISRADVGTVLEGATSQIETSVGISLEQEVRHNFLLVSHLGLSERDYDGVQRDMTTAEFGARGELLLNRFSSIFLSANYSSRFADQDDDEYDRLFLTIGLRFQY